MVFHFCIRVFRELQNHEDVSKVDKCMNDKFAQQIGFK